MQKQHKKVTNSLSKRWSIALQDLEHGIEMMIKSNLNAVNDKEIFGLDLIKENKVIITISPHDTEM